jgi:SAM-dependent methyltransferase
VATDLNVAKAAVQAELGRLPFENACFDIVICSHVLEHIEDDLESMVEMHRVLAPTGKALIMVPVSPRLSETYEDPSLTDAEARKRAFGHPGHVRYYGKDVTARLQGSGFDVDPLEYVDHLPLGEAERIGARRGDLIYVCRS